MIQKYFVLVITATFFSTVRAESLDIYSRKSQYDHAMLPFDQKVKINFNTNYVISTSDTVFDCHGGVFDGQGKKSTGVLVESYGNNISNIIIRNCTFKNFKYNGIRVGWGVQDILKNKIVNGDIYNYHPHNVVIDNVRVINSGTTGIYVDDHVSNVVIKNSLIHGSRGVAIYLEFSSKNNDIFNNTITQNGFNSLRGNREGISIDGSFGNNISNNTFNGNALGGIFLYKNCQEFVSKGNSSKRKNGADNNLITSNQFLNEPTGVWIASRQSLDLSKWDCGDKPIFEHKYYQDYASHNVVNDNTFKNVKDAIIVEGDYNTIQGNKFVNVSGEKIKVPVIPRAIYLNKPQVGNIIQNNN